MQPDYNPNQPFNPSAYPGGLPNQNAPIQPYQLPTSSSPKSKKSRLIIIVAVLVTLVLLVIIVIAIALSGTEKTPSSTNTPQTTQPEGPQPATAVDVEQTNNSISQDISGINDDREIPATQLDDANLSL